MQGLQRREGPSPQHSQQGSRKTTTSHASLCCTRTPHSTTCCVSVAAVSYRVCTGGCHQHTQQGTAKDIRPPTPPRHVCAWQHPDTTTGHRAPTHCAIAALPHMTIQWAASMCNVGGLGPAPVGWGVTPRVSVRWGACRTPFTPNFLPPAPGTLSL